MNMLQPTGDTRDVGYEKVTVKVEKDYEVEYKYHTCEEVTDKGKCKGKEYHEDGKETGTAEQTRIYLIPYKYQYYMVNNFKMFKLKDVTLHDTGGQVGGQLFVNANNTSLNLNSNYQRRFDSSKTFARQNRPNHWVNPDSYEWKMSGTWKPEEKMEWGEYIESEAEEMAKELGKDSALKEIEKLTDAQFANNKSVTLHLRNDAISLEGIQIVPESHLQRVINLSNYTTKEPYGTTIEMDAKKPNFTLISQLRPSPEYKPTNPRPMQMTEYTNSNRIPLTRENGKRVLSATLEYMLITGTTLNVGGTTNSADNSYNYPRYKTLPKPDPQWNFNKLHKVQGEGHVEPVIVHAPIKAGANLKNIDGVIDHTTEGTVPEDVINKNSKFEIVPICKEGGGECGSIGEDHPRYKDKYSGPITYDKYIKGYFVMFNFDVQIPGRGETIYGAGNWIYFDKKESIIAQANKRVSDGMGNVIEQRNNTYQVRTVAINAPDKLIERMSVSDLDMSYIGNAADNGNNLYNAEYAGGPCYASGKYVWAHGKNLSQEATYITQTELKETNNLDRMYDFRVTDLLDVDWKNVFRKYDNTHTGNYYTAGRRGFNMYSGDINESGNITSSTADGFRTDIGSNPYRIIPLSAYKHANNQYTAAPKMGYRFSFDLKTTGEIKDDKKQVKQVDVKAKFYYISKDGKTYYSNDEIDLYYQNESGQYVKIEEGKNTGYTIKMRPSDGYRYIEGDYSDSMLSKNLIEISSDLVNIHLDPSTNMTKNERNFTQLWYGEYKLPNSTIAVLNSKAGGASDVNKPLTNGYIGVIFDITLTETQYGVETRKLSYGTNDSGKGENSSQWDYEGNFGIYDNQKTKTVSTAAISNSNTVFIPLEKGPNSSNGANGLTVGNTVQFYKYNSKGQYTKVSMSGNDFYNQIKGTVMLYDTDARAAEDFDFSGSK